MDPFHRRLAHLVLTADEKLGLVLAGGYAIRAHGLTCRPSQDLDFVTRSPLPMAEVVDRLAQVLREAGCAVAVIEAAPLMARMETTFEGRVCEIDLLKGPIGSPVLLEIGPVLAMDDAVGMKVAALHDRATHRDFVDVHAAADAGYTLTDLERLGAAHKPGFSVEELMDRLEAVELRADQRFLDYGLTGEQIAELRRWALVWAHGIRRRLASGNIDIAGPTASEPDWDEYLKD
ncbi:nucleotidyl transferase AbiEii/AbiGii toxin family protein [Krasilnikovia sp. MM14-A1259]|uniref:nucleotidyl transferase AbiEii/AbiGii toxin family protein n=1 Tax=Krasilnikovia sp. MM14-A1259 TaxID=3373539 RepID=UPI003802B3B5